MYFIILKVKKNFISWTNEIWLFLRKKIRSTIIFDTGKLFKVSEKKLINLCAAVECIHSYSLIHDDLPCMDDDSIEEENFQHIKNL